MKKLLISVLLVLVMGVSCGPGGPIIITTQPPVIDSFDASPPTIAAGESSTLSWKVSGATTVSIDEGIGNVALTGTRAVSPGTTTVYTLKATNSTGASATATAQVIVSGAPTPDNLPVVNSFTAIPSDITAGSSSTLSWSVSNATSVTIEPGVGTFVSSGHTIVSPAATTTYILTATNADGSTRARTQVAVSGMPTPGGLPVVSYFTADPPIISAGGSTTLSWSVLNATSVTIEPGVGSVDSSGAASVSPATDTDYTLTATNATGTYYITIPVMVTGGEADATPPSVPALLSPASGAVLPQKTVPWSFDWSDSSDSESGVSQYQIQVYRVVSSPFIDVNTVSSDYSQVAEVAYPYISGWKWRVRAQNNAGLWSAWSSAGTFDVEPRVAYDFVDRASTAYWWTKVGSDFVELPFPGSLSDDKGFATYRYNVKLNDGSTYAKVLETHPQWVDNGWISGKYSAVSVPSGAKLRIKIGFVSGAGAGKAKFYIGKLGAVATISTVSAYADGVKQMEADLSAYEGQTIDFVLGANAEGSAAQDWAAWAEAKIVY